MNNNLELAAKRAKDAIDRVAIPDVHGVVRVAGELPLESLGHPGRRGLVPEEDAPHVVVDPNDVEAELVEVTRGLGPDQPAGTGDHRGAHRSPRLPTVLDANLDIAPSLESRGGRYVLPGAPTGFPIRALIASGAMRSVSRALVLGGSGFIGTRLVELLLANDVQTTVLDSHGAAATRGERVRGIRATVTQQSVADALELEALDAVFHLANPASVPASVERPLDDLEGSIVTTVSALEALRRHGGHPVFVYVSSAAVYGDAVYHPMDEDHPLEPKSPYGVAKLASERYVRLYSRLHGLQGFSVRPFSVYGPGQRQLVVYDLMKRLHEGERPLRILSPPDVSRDFVFVDDVARGLLALTRAAPAEGEAYNLASGAPTTLSELASTLVEVSGIASEIEFTGEVRPGDPLHWTGGFRAGATPRGRLRHSVG